jgi:hypothetical protein
MASSRRAGLAVIGAMAFLASATPAVADTGTGECRQAVNAFLISLSDEGTRGDFMSDVIFGNEPNRVGGSVVPSQSPGPFVNTGPNEPPRNDRVRGFGGNDLQPLLQAACE